ncbi:hypothetical protein [Flagellimonas marina]|uniref:Uncharacterized protein n=1 Tax=Flagellimonas marina TaxID=1775168 RepID=A0ABV8PRF0_9FLAO
MRFIIMLNVFFVSFLGTLSAQEKCKDTLFFRWDESYFRTYEAAPKDIYVGEKWADETFFFIQIGEIKKIRSLKTYSLKRYIRKLNCNPKKKNKHIVDALKLSGHFSEYCIYLVKKGKNKVIEVAVAVEIE